MKKVTYFVTVLLLMLVLVACSGKSEKVEEKSQEKSGAIVVEKDKDDETKEESKDEDASKEEVVEKEEEEIEEDKEDEEVSALVLDGSKSGIELLKTITFNVPKTIISTTESVAADGTVTIGKSYTKGDFMRNEINSDDSGLQISIYNPETGISYMYSDVDKTGVKYYDDEEDESLVEEVDLTGATYADLFLEEELSNTEANLEELNGNQVVHLHTSSTDTENGTMDIHMWYAVEYAIVMKYEMYLNGALMDSSKVIDYEINVDIDDSLFEEPEGVTFMEW